MSNHQPAAAGRSMTIVLCILTTFCEGIDLQAAGVAAAGIVSEYHPDARTLGAFFSASTLGLFVGALLGGKLADHVGRKRVLVSSVAVFGVFSLLTAYAWDMSSLTWMRLLTGLGLGGALPNLIALVAESSGEQRRNANVTLVYAGTPLGGALISLVSMLSPTEAWRWLFIIGGVVPLLLTPIMVRYLQESTDFLAARSNAHVSHAMRPTAWQALFGEGRALRTLLLWCSFFLALLTLYLLLNWLPTLLIDKGLNKLQSAMAQIGFNLGGAAAALWIGRMLDGRWRRVSVLVNFAVLPILLILLAQSSTQVAYVASVVLLLGAAVVAAQAFLYATSQACYPVLVRGLGVGLAVAIGRIGSIVGPQWGGMLKAAGYSSGQLLLSLVPVMVGSGVCAVALVWLRAAPAATKTD